jgi:hypothetical protein
MRSSKQKNKQLNTNHCFLPALFPAARLHRALYFQKRLACERIPDKNEPAGETLSTGGFSNVKKQENRMGQYFTALVIDQDNKITKVNPGAFGNHIGVKLMEHAWIEDEFVNAVYSLICNNPCKVAWIGDYSNEPYDPEHDAYAKAMPHEKFMEMYRFAWGEDTPSLTEKDFDGYDLRLVNFDVKGVFLVNHDLKCYIDLVACMAHSTVQSGCMAGWCINPLPLLTACGNDRGFGDFHEGGTGYEDIGTWAFHRIEYTEGMPPEDYTEQFCCFIEAGTNQKNHGTLI